MLKSIISHTVIDIALNVFFNKLASNIAMPLLKTIKLGNRYKKIIKQFDIVEKSFIYYDAEIVYVDNDVIVFKYAYRESIFDTTTSKGRLSKLVQLSLFNCEIIEETEYRTITRTLSGELIVDTMDLHKYELIN